MGTGRHLHRKHVGQLAVGKPPILKAAGVVTYGCEKEEHRNFAWLTAEQSRCMFATDRESEERTGLVNLS